MVDDLHYSFPSSTSGPKIMPHHFTCHKIGPTKKLIMLGQKFDNVEPD